MFTDRFKLLVALIIALLIFGGLTVNEVILNNKIEHLQQLVIIKQVIASPSATFAPATPTPIKIVKKK